MKHIITGKRVTSKQYPDKFKAGEAVVFDPPGWKVEDYPAHPLHRNEVVYFLANIPNAPGHCIVVTLKGQVMSMTHTFDLRKAKETEI